MHARKQTGASTIIIAILLLVILTVVTAFSLNVGLFEQRSVGNENRARIVQHVADAGLNHGIEVLKANAALLVLPDTEGGWSSRWRSHRCAAADTTFPCGAEADPARRQTLYRYLDTGAAAGSQTNFIGAGSRVSGAAAINTVAVDGTVDATAVSNFGVDYRVGALLCLVDDQDPALCKNYEDNYSGLLSVSLISRARLADDPDALADVKATVATYRTIGRGPDVPILASGSVNLSGGTADIVPNPNAGGVGVALSVWSGGPTDFGGTGAIKSCHMGEFLINYSSTGPVEYQGMQRCDTCACDGLPVDKGLISGKYTAPGTGTGQMKNYDILDSTGGVLPPNSYFPDADLGIDNPTDCFDDNLFEYLFAVDYVNPGGATGCTVVPQGDIAYLENNAQEITGADDGNPDTVDTCPALAYDPALAIEDNPSGLYWYKGDGCDLQGSGSSSQFGTPNNPIFLVVDGCQVRVAANTVFFGVVFMRSPDPVICADFDFNTSGGPTIYGAIVVDGAVMITGSPKFVYSEKVIQSLVNSSAFTRFGVVPGSWIDVVDIGG